MGDTEERRETVGTCALCGVEIDCDDPRGVLSIKTYMEGGPARFSLPLLLCGLCIERLDDLFAQEWKSPEEIGKEATEGAKSALGV